MDSKLDDLLTLVVEPPSPSWRFRMRIEHQMPRWTFPFFTDRFNDRFRNAEIENDIEAFQHYCQSIGHRNFMKFWVNKTKAAFNWSNFLSWTLKSDVNIDKVNGIDTHFLCQICKRDCRSPSDIDQWRRG